MRRGDTADNAADNFPRRRKKPAENGNESGKTKTKAEKQTKARRGKIAAARRFFAINFLPDKTPPAPLRKFAKTPARFLRKKTDQCPPAQRGAYLRISAEGEILLYFLYTLEKYSGSAYPTRAAISPTEENPCLMSMTAASMRFCVR